MCTVRYIGRSLPDDPLEAPWPVVERLAAQLGIEDPSVVDRDAVEEDVLAALSLGMPVTEHLAELVLGLDAGWKQLAEGLEEAGPAARSCATGATDHSAPWTS